MTRENPLNALLSNWGDDLTSVYDLLAGVGYEHFRSFLREYKVYEDAAAEGMSILNFPASSSRPTANLQADLFTVTAELVTVSANSPAAGRTSA